MNMSRSRFAKTYEREINLFFIYYLFIIYYIIYYLFFGDFDEKKNSNFIQSIFLTTEK